MSCDDNECYRYDSHRLDAKVVKIMQVGSEGKWLRVMAMKRRLISYFSPHYSRALFN
jgi:hypothetical protein